MKIEGIGQWEKTVDRKKAVSAIFIKRDEVDDVFYKIGAEE